MYWTDDRVIVLVFAIAAIAGGVWLILNRERVNRRIVKGNRELWGDRVGDQMEQVGSTLGVVIPAVGAILIGLVALIAGIFGNPHQ